MTSIQEINSTIMNGDFTNEQLQSIVDAIKYRRHRLTQANIWSLRVGDTVSFINKRGSKSVGTVTDLKQKNVLVMVGATTWRVPANMLTLEEKIPA